MLYRRIFFEASHTYDYVKKTIITRQFAQMLLNGEALHARSKKGKRITDQNTTQTATSTMTPVFFKDISAWKNYMHR